MKKIVSLLVLAGLLAGFAGCSFLPRPDTTLPYSAQPTTPPAPGQTAVPEVPVSTPAPENTAAVSGQSYHALQYPDMKAIWLSQFDLTDLYRSGDGQRSKSDFTKRMAALLDNVKAAGFNTVFLQVRPNGDSMYPSEYYPMSAYVTGTLGAEASYDPVAIIVELAHDRQLSIHAWINPMRAMSEDEITQVDSRYALRKWYDSPSVHGKYLILVDGKWYLNPAYKDVTDLIVGGARELLTRYEFDGLHLDDYFYPTADPSFDDAAYQAFGTHKSLADFRRGNINLLVRQLYELTHSTGINRLFGISPAGNVDTVYGQHFADVYQWCQTPGYLDYICPQVYFGLEHSSLDFNKVCKTFDDMIQTSSVKLVIGMTFGKALTGEDPWAGTGKTEWIDRKDVLVRCLDATQQLTHCQGVSVFCYQYLYDPLTGTPIPETAQERETFLSLLRQISW